MSTPIFMLTKKLDLRILVWSVLIVFSSCIDEKVVPVVIKLNYEVANNDYSIPVEITFDNETIGAENYKWTFEGGEPSTSDKRNPGTILFTKGGNYKVTLEAWNEDDHQVKEIDLQIYGTVDINFETSIAINTISPVTLSLTNKTTGGTAYHWKFQDGNPSTFTGYNPPAIEYILPGDHRITLIVENGLEKDSVSKVITVLPALVVDFTIEPSFQDDDYEAPLTANLVNNSVSGLTWQWSSTSGGEIEIEDKTTEQSSVYFASPGTYTISLTASNGKEIKTVSKDIVVKPNTRLRTLTDVKLGINTAHSTIGSFYSTILRRVIKKSDPDSLGKYIDLAFFGLNSSFTFNKFVSPDSVQNYTFDAITQAQTTHYINSLDKCTCGITFTESDFDQMINDDPLQPISIQSTFNGLKPFDNTVFPRIVLFRTKDNRKGAIKIKAFQSSGSQSYILVDIKVQKQ